MRLNALIGLSAAGVAMAVYLTWVALATDAEPFCSGIGSCSEVQSSEYATVLGIPIAAFGLAMYAGLLALTLVRRLQGDRPLLAAWTFALALSGVLYSAYLTYLELFVLEAICVWCVASAVLVAVIFVLTVPDFIAARQAQLAALAAEEQ